MRKPEEILSDSKESREKYYKNDDVVKNVIEVVSYLRRRSIESLTGDELSRAAVRLSILLVNLGQKVADAQLVANASYSYRKFKKASAVNRLTIELDKVTLAKEKAQTEVSKEIEQEHNNRHLADSLTALYSDAERLVSVIQSRIRTLTSDWIRSNNPEQ